ncbi:MAG: DUF2520 domain-containing protein, partial [Bacteroidia bacterium]|nr:DUF2520 domain-containing protein [Bacteroidia bacterium]
MININLIGAGNLAHHLFRGIYNSEGVKLQQWYSRDKKRLSAFSSKTGIIHDLKALQQADLTILAVSDDAIGELSSALPFDDQLVVHTSGSVSIHELDKKHRRGVFYPLQTFSKDVDVDFSHVPFCLEILEKEDLILLKKVCEAIGSPYYKINTEQRQTLHLAAVFVNNFTNQLYRIGHEITDIKNINFDILKPLILETAKKVQEVSPYMAQTGPAKRYDKK